MFSKKDLLQPVMKEY